LLRGVKKYKRIKKKLRQTIEKQKDEQIIGDFRERKVYLALESLKKKGLIRNFLKTKKLSYPDLMLGIDFYIVFIDNEYHALPFSVTGPRWVDVHFEKHPEIPVIAVNLEDSRVAIEEKILNLIEKRKN
jgi:hypothetical protein